MLISPSNNVPVITVPNPFTVKILSILSLGDKFSLSFSILLLNSSIFNISSSIPFLDLESTSNTLLSSKKVPCTFSLISSFIISNNYYSFINYILF